MVRGCLGTIATARSLRLMQGWTRRWTDPVDEGSGSLRDRVARARGLDIETLGRYCSPTVESVCVPDALPGARAVAARLVNSLRADKSIVIYGDYDADGMCAAAILMHVLRALRPDAPPRVHIPDRRSDGYGLSVRPLEELAQQGAQTIVTVDCGVTGFAPAVRARELGLELLITDHHALGPGGAMAEAAAIAHPGVGGALGEVCGATVAWLVACATVEAWYADKTVPSETSQLLVELLALAAIGTVADVMPLIGQSRAVAALGLSRANRSALPGVAALKTGGGIRSYERLDAEAVGFRVAPLLNACGRLGQPADAVELLSLACGGSHAASTLRDTRRATEIVGAFGKLNEQRKQLEREIVNAAQRRLDEGFGAKRGAIVLSSREWRREVVGIACARIAEREGVPVVLLEEHNGVAHGSGRGISGYSLLEGLRSCEHLLERYGGHASAAGVSVQVAHIPAFREALSSHAAENAPRLGPPTITADTIVHPEDIDVRAIEAVDSLGPFGHGFPQPKLLVRQAVIRSAPEVFGAERDHLRFFAAHAAKPSRELRCVWWRHGAMLQKLRPGSRVHLVGCVQIDRYGGAPKPAFRVIDIADAS